MIAHITEACTCKVTCSVSTELVTCCMLSPVCEISPDSTSSKSELLDTVYVASARMRTIVSFVLFPMHAVYSGSLFTFVAKPILPAVILCLQLSYSG